MIIPADDLALGPCDQIPADFGERTAAEYVREALGRGGANSYLSADATDDQAMVRKFLLADPNPARHFVGLFDTLEGC